MSIEIKATKRDVKGTGASRRLRRAGTVPGVCMVVVKTQCLSN
jgi:large subunit ribosomal protein L25